MDMLPFLAPLLGGFILFAIMQVAVKAPGRELQGKFQSLGNFKGKTEREMVAVVGPARSRSVQPGGKFLLQWMATGYHIAVLFDAEGKAEGVTHEHSAG